MTVLFELSPYVGVSDQYVIVYTDFSNSTKDVYCKLLIL